MVKCLAPTVCKGVLPSLPPSQALTECAACPLDEHPPKPCGQVTVSGGQGTTRTRHALNPVATNTPKVTTHLTPHSHVE